MKTSLRLFTVLFFFGLILSCSSEGGGGSSDTETFKLVVIASTGGTVSTSGGTYEKGTQVEVTATPNSNYGFVSWDGFSSQSETINIVMFRDYEITANFGALPQEVSLVFPENQTSCQEGEAIDELNSRLRFEWDANGSVGNYNLIITNEEQQETKSMYGINATQTEVDLVHDILYSWYVETVSPVDGLVKASETFSFYLEGDGRENHVPFPAVAIEPLNGAAVDVINGQVQLEWQSTDLDDDDLLYTLYFGPTKDDLNIVSGYGNVPENRAGVNVEPNSIYYWQVRTSDGNSSSFSPIYGFRTLN